MKKIVLFSVLFLMTNLSFSQTEEINGTSLEEYNYMTKGYKIQKNSGLDMKRGYKLVKLQKITKGKYSFSFNSLMRIEKKEIAGTLIIAYSKVSGRTYYLGMPVNNSELQLYFENDIRLWDESMTTAYAYAVSELYSKTFFSYNIELNNKEENTDKE